MIVLVLLVIIISSVMRDSYGGETKRRNDAFNRYIDDYLENGISSKEPYTKSWTDFLGNEEVEED